MALYIPLHCRSPHRSATAPSPLTEGLVLSRGNLSSPLRLIDLPGHIEQHQLQCAWVPFTRTQLINADLDVLLPHVLTGDLIPLPLRLWLDDHALDWDGDMPLEQQQRLHHALQLIDQALHLRPGHSLRTAVLQHVPSGATTALPVPQADVGPLPEAAASSNSARAFTPLYAPTRLSGGVPIGPWLPLPPGDRICGRDDDIHVLAQLLSIEWIEDVPASIRERYRPGRWYATPELEVLMAWARLAFGAVYRTLVSGLTWASSTPISASLASWSWHGEDLLDTVATTVATAVWSVLSADTSAAGEWWRSYDRAQRLTATMFSGGHCEPVAPSRLSLTGPDAMREALRAGWMPTARHLANIDSATRRHWAVTLATHPQRGLSHCAAAQALVFDHADESAPLL